MMEKRQPLQQMLLGKLDLCMQKTEARYRLFTLLKKNETLNISFNIRPETLKLVQETAGNTLEAIGKAMTSLIELKWPNK
jgi:hypothetical protein